MSDCRNPNAKRPPSSNEVLADLSELFTDPRRGPRRKREGSLRDFVAELTEFENTADRENRFVISRCPQFLRRQLEVFQLCPQPPKTLQDTVAFCVREGVQLLRQVPGVEQIREARRIVLESGDDAIAWFDEWSFELEGRYAGRQTLYARVCPEDAARCNQLAAHVLGLPASTVACLAIEAVLIHVPVVPDRHKRHMATELVTFTRQVKRRATEATEHASRAVQMTKTLSLSFEDVLEEAKGDE